jgi:P27 family predicted phage terminase small subunit
MDLKPDTGFAFEEIPEAPQELSAAALKFWHQIIPVIFDLKTGRPADIPSLIILCEALVDLNALQATLRKEGFTTESAAGSKKTHPAQRSLENARQQVDLMMSRFGLIRGAYAQKAPDYADHLAHFRRLHPDE